MGSEMCIRDSIYPLVLPPSTFVLVVADSKLSNSLCLAFSLVLVPVVSIVISAAVGPPVGKVSDKLFIIFVVAGNPSKYYFKCSSCIFLPILTLFSNIKIPG